MIDGVVIGIVVALFATFIVWLIVGRRVQLWLKDKIPWLFRFRDGDTKARTTVRPLPSNLSWGKGMLLGAVATATFWLVWATTITDIVGERRRLTAMADSLDAAIAEFEGGLKVDLVHVEGTAPAPGLPQDPYEAMVPVFTEFQNTSDRPTSIDSIDVDVRLAGSAQTIDMDCTRADVVLMDPDGNPSRGVFNPRTGGRVLPGGKWAAVLPCVVRNVRNRAQLAQAGTMYYVRAVDIHGRVAADSFLASGLEGPIDSFLVRIR